MAAGAIPLSEIVAYLGLHQIENLDERLEYSKWIRFLDRVYLKLVHDQHTKDHPTK